MKTRLLHTKFYKDKFIRSLSVVEKFLFNYLLTNEYVNIIHCYECSDDIITFDTGIDTPMILVSKEKFEKAGKIFFKDDFIFLKNAHKYETYVGPQNEACKQKLVQQMSIEIREWFTGLTDTPIYTPIYTPENTETINKKSEIINPKKEIRNQNVRIDEGLKKIGMDDLPDLNKIEF